LIDQKELKKKVKAFHKRQKTHVNFHNLANVNKNTIISESTNKDQDLFDLTLTGLNSNRTMRKVSDVDTRETAESTGSMHIPVNTSTGSLGSKPLGKQLYLFYRTPNNKDTTTKKFDFSDTNISNAD
jgi:hypothetical protein